MARKKKNNSSRTSQYSREKNLMALADPKSPISEAYRVIRTNLQFASLDKPIKSILITSTAPSEGKSTVVSNLAITLAQNSKHVLILDADLRKSMQHKFWHLPNISGLTSVLVENIDYHMVVRKTLVPGVEVLTAGPKPPNPTELLGSRRMAEFLQKISEDYDYVLVDAPPVMPVADAAVLAHSVNGVILIIGYGLATYEASAKAKEQLEKANANILGVIINNVPVDSHSYYYYYYYYDEKGQKVRRSHHRGSSVEYGAFETSSTDTETSTAERDSHWLK